MQGSSILLESFCYAEPWVEVRIERKQNRWNKRKQELQGMMESSDGKSLFAVDAQK